MPQHRRESVPTWKFQLEVSAAIASVAAAALSLLGGPGHCEPSPPGPFVVVVVLHADRGASSSGSDVLVLPHASGGEIPGGAGTGLD